MEIVSDVQQIEVNSDGTGIIKEVITIDKDDLGTNLIVNVEMVRRKIGKVKQDYREIYLLI